MYKFALFSHLNLDRNACVNKYGDKDFQKKWRSHAFDELADLCQKKQLKFSQDIPFLGNNKLKKETKELIESWDVQIRYGLTMSKKTVILEEETLKDYIGIIIIINTKINDLYS